MTPATASGPFSGTASGMAHNTAGGMASGTAGGRLSDQLTRLVTAVVGTNETLQADLTCLVTGLTHSLPQSQPKRWTNVRPFPSWTRTFFQGNLIFFRRRVCFLGLSMLLLHCSERQEVHAVFLACAHEGNPGMPHGQNSYKHGCPLRWL